MFYDIIVVGAGPAGLTAALYALRADKKVLVIEKSTPGGQITYSPKVENYPGFMEMSGNEFADLLLDQIMAQGADFELGKVIEIKNGDVKTVVTEDGEFTAKAVIIATGVKHRMLGLEGENELVGRGISFCAVCDGAFHEGKDVCVLGGGNSALQEALLLSDLCNKVYVVQNLEKLTGEGKLADKLYEKENVEIITSSVITELLGEDELNGVIIKNDNGESRTLMVDGLFVAIGLIPQNDIFANVLKLNAYGYADVDESCKAEVKGIFVAGDCRSKKIRQVATACADGAVAALAACDFIEGR